MKPSGPLRRTPMRRKAKKNPMPPGRWNEVMTRDQFCQGPRHGLITRCEGPPEVHHLRNRGMGGSSDPEIHALANLMLLCQKHHRWVTEHPEDAKLMGLAE